MSGGWRVCVGGREGVEGCAGLTLMDLGHGERVAGALRVSGGWLGLCAGSTVSDLGAWNPGGCSTAWWWWLAGPAGWVGNRHAG